MACCGTRYYCTAAGPVAVDPDADGWYAVPEGGTSGWYKTYEEAVEVCPEPPVSVECGGYTFTYPSSVVYTLANPSGCLESLSSFSGVVGMADCGVAYGTTTGDEITLPSGCIAAAFLASWAVLMAPETTPGPVYTGNLVQTVTINKVPAASMGGYQWRFTGANGFSDVAANTTAAGLSSRTITGTDGVPASPVNAGLVEILDPSSVVVGSADVYFQ